MAAQVAEELKTVTRYPSYGGTQRREKKEKTIQGVMQDLGLRRSGAAPGLASEGRWFQSLGSPGERKDDDRSFSKSVLHSQSVTGATFNTSRPDITNLFG